MDEYWAFWCGSEIVANIELTVAKPGTVVWHYGREDYTEYGYNDDPCDVRIYVNDITVSEIVEDTDTYHDTTATFSVSAGDTIRMAEGDDPSVYGTKHST